MLDSVWNGPVLLDMDCTTLRNWDSVTLPQWSPPAAAPSACCLVVLGQLIQSLIGRVVSDDEIFNVFLHRRCILDHRDVHGRSGHLRGLEGHTSYRVLKGIGH